MTLVINHHYPDSDPDISRRLGRIEEALRQLLEGFATMQLDFAELQTDLSDETNAITAISALIDSFASAVTDNAANQQKVKDIAAAFRANNAALTAAIAKGTPVDPGTSVPPVPVPTAG